MRITSGPAIQHAGDLAAVLSSLDEGEVLFLDEIHRMSRSAEEMLYLAMEDFRVDVIVGKGPGATAIPLELPPFTVVGATTRAGLLPAPLRDRFGFTAHLDYYDTADLDHDPAPLGAAARASRPTRPASPRSPAARGARRASPTGCCAGCATGPRCTARGTSTPLPRTRRWRSSTSTTLGLDRLDRAVLEALCRRFGGGPVGLSTLAVAVGEESDTVETVAEPFLVREGYIVRTPRGPGGRGPGLAPPRAAGAGRLPAAGRAPLEGGRRGRRPRAVLGVRT